MDSVNEKPSKSNSNMNYYIPPSIGKTQIVRNYPRPAIVNTGDVATHRIEPVYFSSVSPCNKDGAIGPNFVANLSSPHRGVVGTKFLSIQLDYLPVQRATPNQTGFIWLDKFPREGEEVYHETSDGTKYSAKFPLPSTRLCNRRFQYEYTFPDNYFLNMNQIAQTVQRIHFKLLYEDSVTGAIQQFSSASVAVSSLELGFVIQENV
jgi:hypothetical protein